jgi:hypothetical protein
MRSMSSIGRSRRRVGFFRPRDRVRARGRITLTCGMMGAVPVDGLLWIRDPSLARNLFVRVRKDGTRTICS